MHRPLPIKKILRYARNLLIFFFASTILAVIVYRFMPVYVTPLMVIRSVQQLASGDKPTWKHTWVSFDKISPHLPMAVIASEDNRFAEHNGFDFIEIENEGERKTETEARSKYHQSADSQECVPMAAIVLDTQRFRSLFHLSDRVVLVERTDYGGISQLHRNGKRDLWRTGCRKV